MRQQSNQPASKSLRNTPRPLDTDAFHMKRRGTRSFHEGSESSQDLETGGNNATSSVSHSRARQQMGAINSTQIGCRSKNRRNLMIFTCFVVSIYVIVLLTQKPLGGIDFDISGSISQKDLDKLNSRLSKANADEILMWAYHQFPSRLLQQTSFGPSGMVVLHKLYQLGILPDVPVISIDTLHLFPETYDFIGNVRKKYGIKLDLTTFHPTGFDTRSEFDEAFGSSLWKSNPEKYAYLSKVEPMERAMEDMHASALITGRRRTQGGERKNLNVVEFDNLDSARLKINPLVDWTYDDVWSYIRLHNIPYNPLHDKGYKSIGDMMTTVPVDPDADERSGRFVGLNKTECGLHSHLEKIKKMREEAENDNQEFVAPTLECDHCVEVDPKNFDEKVLNAKTDILLEFYSPFCGGCQEMAPKYAKIALTLDSLRDRIRVARFDITEHEIPRSAYDAGMKFEMTPALFLVQHNPSLRVTLYENEHEFAPVMAWIGSKTSYHAIGI